MNENQQDSSEEPLQAGANESAGAPGGGGAGAGPGGWPWQTAWPGSAAPPDRPLRRPYAGRMLGGVAAGVAEYAGVDITIVRLVIAVLCVVGGAGLPLYLAAWLLVPSEGEEHSIAAGWLGHVQ